MLFQEPEGEGLIFLTNVHGENLRELDGMLSELNISLTGRSPHLSLRSLGKGLEPS